ncbi:LysR family transcriptional regulator [Paenibacillus daejeonensis]|uniref:LysR family transcriptional regulator n=1 Tax=Paenibacillus daejeonensis TaxID=135193 RepID=UPI00035F206D|nr:LysR family transcriptional regulator [Paenibacillus daejeonensis]
MNLDQILTFLKVYQVGSFQEAASQLYLPQPTVSHRIHQLEKIVGNPLLIRGKGAVRLTEEGKAFLPYARMVSSAVREGQEAVDQVKSGASGKLAIGCNNSFASCIMPEVLDTFTRKHPDVSIKIYCYSSTELVRLMKNRTFQVGITRYSSNSPDLIYEPVYQDKMKLFVSPKHPFASRKMIPLEEALREPMITYQKSTENRRILEMILTQHNLPFHVKYETNNLGMIKYFIQRNSGVHFSAELYMRNELREGSLVQVDVDPNPFPPGQVYIAYHDGELSSIDRLFIRHFEEVIVNTLG